MARGLKPISLESIPRALEKAQRYRLLNEPFLAESICLDVLAVAPDQPEALTLYVLSITDQFVTAGFEEVSRALATIGRMTSEYERLYYSGIVEERRATASLQRRSADAGTVAWDHIHQAMRFYEKAQALVKDSTNDDAVLRYNTCLRLIAAHRLRAPDGKTEPLLE